MRRLKQMAAILLVFLLFLSVSSLSLAAPPDHAQNNNQKVSPSQSKIFSEREQINNSKQQQKQKTTPPGLRGKGIPPGLIDKGGLPPGMQGRDTLPPGIRMRFADALKNKPAEEAYALIITGEEFIGIPEEGAVTANYEAFLTDTEGNETKIAADWSLSNNPEGVSIDPESGVLEVTDLAEPGDITVEAVYAASKDSEDNEDSILSGSFAVKLYKQEISAITIEGDEFVTIQADDEEPLVLEYTAFAKDQKGKSMEGKTVAWSVTSEDFKPVLIEENMSLAIIIPSKAGSFTVTAMSGEITGRLEVKVYYPAASSIEITGKSFVALLEDEDSVSLTYTALVRDQEGRVMEGEEVTWSADDTAGLLLDNGNVTLTELPEYGEETVFTIKAEYIAANNEIKSAELTVTVYYPVPRSMIITGAPEVTLPGEGEEVTEEYAAAVLDQHGQKLEEEVVWLLTDEYGEEAEIAGVKLDNGTLTVTDEAGEGSVWLWVIYDEEIYCIFEVQLKQDDFIQDA